MKGWEGVKGKCCMEVCGCDFDRKGGHELKVRFGRGVVSRMETIRHLLVGIFS